MNTNIIGHVYRVRTNPTMGKPGIPNNGHYAIKGSLAVVDFAFTDGNYACYCMTPFGQSYHTFRPCDLKRLEDHDYINEVGK